MLEVKIVHNLPGRVRLYIKELKRNSELGTWLRKDILSRPGVEAVDINLSTGKLLIHYNPQVTSPERLVSHRMSGKGEAAVTTQVTAKLLPAAMNPLITEIIPSALVAYFIWKRLRGKSPTMKTGLFGSIVDFFAYSQLFEGVTATLKTRKLDTGLLTGAGSLLAVAQGNILLALAILTLSRYFSSTAQGEKKAAEIKDRTQRLALVPAAGAVLARLQTANPQHTLAALTAGVPLASHIAQGLPLTVLQQKGMAQGFIVKHADAVDQALEIDHLLFLETSLLGEESKEVREVVSLRKGLTPQELLSLVGGAYVHYGSTTTGAAVLDKIKEWEIPVAGLSKVQAEGKILRAVFDQGRILIGGQKELERKGVTVKPGLAHIWKFRHLQLEPRLVAVNNELVGLFGLSNTSVSKARELVESIRNQGVTSIGLISSEGDAEQPNYLQNLGLEPLETEMKLEEQLRLITELKRQGKRVALVGNRVPDVQLFRAAELAVCFSDTHPQVIDAAAVIIDNKRKEGLAQFFLAAALNREIIRQNYSLLSIQSMLGTVLGVSGKISPTAGLLFPLTAGLMSLYNTRRLNSYFPLLK